MLFLNLFALIPVMKFKTLLIIFLSSISLGYCQFSKLIPEVNPIKIQNNYDNWVKYQNQNITLSVDFESFDLNSKAITKALFLQQLLLGKTIPIKLQTNNNEIKYKLYKITKNADTSITAVISQIAFDEYEHFKMENKDFPNFALIDINGNLITNQTMKNKIIVIKCWYIHCAACIKEFPTVNKLVEKYKNNKDLVFMSLAEDNAEQLKLFLAAKPLLYLVVPNMKEFMNSNLKLNAFPTHIIVGKNGKIKKVLSNVKSLEIALETELKK